MDILALRRQGFSMRYVARKLGIHRNMVKKYLESKAPPKYRIGKRKESVLDPYRRIIDDYLQNDDYRTTWLFDRITKIGYQGSYDTVKTYIRQVKERLTRLAYIRFETEPGLQAQVDWGDFQVQEPTGLVRTIYAFVMVLGFCRAMYVEFVRRCTLEAFMDCHIRAFPYLKGVPEGILYDNMKDVVIGRKHGRVDFNVEFLHFAGHYQFQPKPCPPYSPWVKGKAERPMDYLRERFWRGYVYNAIDQANSDVSDWLNEVANQRIHGTHHQPVSLRLAAGNRAHRQTTGYRLRHLHQGVPQRSTRTVRFLTIATTMWSPTMWWAKRSCLRSRTEPSDFTTTISCWPRITNLKVSIT